jgi:mannose-6-phosphate isomerase-like protein (cupin superfamily)
MTHFIDMARKAGEDSGQGALWGVESHDLDCTLVAWPKGEGVTKHTNEEIDVVMIVMEGRALVELPGKDQQLMEGQLLLIRKGTSRRIEALSERLVYLNVHKRRKMMGLGDLGAYRDRPEPAQ